VNEEAVISLLHSPIRFALQQKIKSYVTLLKYFRIELVNM